MASAARIALALWIYAGANYAHAFDPGLRGAGAKARGATEVPELALDLGDASREARRHFEYGFHHPQLAQGPGQRRGKLPELDLGESLARAGDANYALSFSQLDQYPSFQRANGIGWLVRSGATISDAGGGASASQRSPSRGAPSRS
jgi:hypothetical protein